MAPQATKPSSPTATAKGPTDYVSKAGTIAACGVLAFYLILFLIVLIGYLIQKRAAKNAPPPPNFQPQIASRSHRPMSQASFLNGPEAPRTVRPVSSESGDGNDSRNGSRSRSSSASTARYYYPERYGQDQPAEQTMPTIPVVKINA